MKKIVYSLFLVLVLSVHAKAQSCNASGASQCTASGTLLIPGLSPTSDLLPAFENGIPSTTVIQFKNFNQVLYQGLTLTVQTLRIDSIENLPPGLCWATNKANNTYSNQESGCIKINGTPCGTPGQYKLKLIVTVNVGITQQINAESAGLKYFVRLGNYGDVVPAVDTLQTIPLYTTGYSPTANCSPVICNAFTFSSSNTANTSCASPNGSLSVSASGGTAPYEYFLGTDSNNTGNFNGLSGGTYTVDVRDVNHCTGSTLVNVSTTTPTITVSVSKTAITSCVSANGSISASASGGASPYTYAITGATNSTGSFTALASGNYSVTATDGNGCTQVQQVTVEDSTATVTATTSSTNASNSTAANGTATVNSNGGTSPYTYSWSGTNQTTSTVTGLVQGSYTVTVTDINGCSVSATVSVGFNVGVNNIKGEILEVKIFPNPATDKITVTAQLASIQKVTIEISTLTGQKIQNRNIGLTDKVSESLSLLDLPKGSYIMRINAGKNSADYTVVLQ